MSDIKDNLRRLVLSLSEDEEINLKKSADTLRSILDDCEI